MEKKLTTCTAHKHAVYGKDCYVHKLKYCTICSRFHYVKKSDDEIERDKAAEKSVYNIVNFLRDKSGET